jgi:serine kinase of HPr protein (carbohydrate metabolism regulator)
MSLSQFLTADAYRPLPTQAEAARELFRTGNLRLVHLAAAATDGAVEAVATIARDVASTGTRHLVLLTGERGAGKTLVGLKVVHATCSMT